MLVALLDLMKFIKVVECLEALIKVPHFLLCVESDNSVRMSYNIERDNVEPNIEDKLGGEN